MQKRRANPLGWMLPSFGATWALIVLWLTTSALSLKLFGVDGDVGRHIRVGEWILEHQAIPRVDTFSHTMQGQAFVPYEWLSEVAVAVVHRYLGLAGVALLTGALAALACWVVYATALKLGAGPLLALVAAIYSFALELIHLLPRPHMFTIALAAVFVAVLVEYRRSGRARMVWSLVPLMLLWANLHGGFLVGIVLLVLFLGAAVFEGERARVRTLTLVGLASILATFVNPAGPELWSHCTGYLRNDFLVRATHEYRSPDFHALEFKLFLGGLVAMVGVAMSGRVKFTIVETGLTLFWMAASLHSARNIPLFGVVVVPFLARWVSVVCAKWVARWEERAWAIEHPCSKRLVPALVALVVVGWAVAHRADKRFTFPSTIFPVAAVERVKGLKLEGNVFNHFEWGGYVLYAAPEIAVFIDGQTDFYGEALTRDYLKAIRLEPGWDEVLKRHRIAWTLTASDAPLNRALELSPEWKLEYRDDVATIYVKTSSQHPVAGSQGRRDGFAVAEPWR